MLIENLPNLIFSLLVFGFVGVLAGVVISLLGGVDFKFYLMIFAPVFLFTLLISFVSLVLIFTSREQIMWHWYFLGFGLSACFYYIMCLITAWICKKIWAMF